MNNQRRMVIATLIVSGVGILAYRSRGAEPPAVDAAREHVPQYTAAGEMKLPHDFRNWVFVGAALGLSYSEHAPYADEQKFTNIYITPAAYAEFERNGSFPEKTMLAMAVYRQRKKQPHGELKLQGSFEGELLSVELAVKDAARFDDSWSYFDFSPAAGETKLRETAKPFATQTCYDCHAEHGEVDNVFVQFYPVLRRLQK